MKELFGEGIYEKLINTANNLIIGLDLKGNIIYFNKRAESVTGYKANEVIGKNMFSKIVPGTLKETLRAFAPAKKGKLFQAYPIPIITKKGKERIISWTSTCLKNKNRKVVGIFSIGQDVTEQKKFEENILKIKKSYERVTDNADEAIFRVDAKGGHVIYANPAAERIFGYSKAEWFSDPALGFKIIHPDYAEKQKQIIKEVNTNKKPINSVLGWIAKDGSEVIMEYTIIPIKDKDDKIIYFESIGKDITEKKKAEKKLKQATDEWKETFDSIQDLVSIQDKNCRIVKVNKAYADTFKMKPEELIGKHCYKIVHGMNKPWPDCPHKKTIKTGKPVVREFFEPKLGLWVEVSTSPLYGHNGKILGSTHIVKNVTERKESEERIKESEAKHRLLYETSADAIMTLEPPTWKFTAGNPATVKMFRTGTEKKFTSLGPWQVSPKYQPDGQLSTAKAKKMIMKAMKEGSNFFEWTHKRFQGEDFPATVLLTRIEESGKKYLQATVRDISEQKKAEHKVKKSEEKFRLIFEGATDGILAADVKTKSVVFGNPRICELTGYPLKELLKLSVDQIHSKKDLPYVLDQFQKQAKGEIQVAKDIPILRKDKNIIYCDVSSTAVKIGGQDILLGFFRDVTEHRKTEEEIKKRTEELEKFYKIAVDREHKMIELKKELEKFRRSGVKNKTK